MDATRAGMRQASHRSPRHDRKWAWKIDKYADKSELTLMPNESDDVNYTVDVSPGSPIDSNFAVSGTITITNPAYKAAKITSVTDTVTPGDYAMKVDCGVYFPYTLAAGGTLECKYEGYLPDDDKRTNTAKVESEYVGGGYGTAPVDFYNAKLNYEVDECIDVADSLQGALGYVCADKAPYSFKSTYTIDPYYKCGDFVVYNAAKFTTKDTYAYGEDSWNVKVHVPCAYGCTLTQGYWKNHSEKGPAPTDKTWAKLPYGAGTYFYKSGKTWHQVFKTPPAGNTYYNLARQFMAARLNILSGASSAAAVDDALAQAEAMFAYYTPESWTAKYSKAQLNGWAATLDKYNNGTVGPGHCDENKH